MKHTLILLTLGLLSGAASAGEFVLNFESINWSAQFPSRPRQVRDTITGGEYLDLEPSIRNNHSVGQLRVKIDGLFNDLFIHDKDGSHASELICLEQALQAGKIHSLEMHGRDLGDWANHRGQTSLDKVSLRLTNAPDVVLARDNRGLPKICEALLALRNTQVQTEDGEDTSH